MKEFRKLETLEKNEITELFTVWLKPYTHEVICKVMQKADEIINNKFVMNLLIELRDREETEKEDFKNSIYTLLGNFEDFKEYNPHNHPLTHSDSYRDVLYDMYIR